MNLIDLLIILLVLASVVRGRRIGLVRQVGSTIGFVIGLFLGSWAGALAAQHINGSANRTIVSLLLVLVGGFLCMTLGEITGIWLKLKLTRNYHLDRLDGWLGSGVAAVTILFAFWLGASILVLGSGGSLQQQIKSSRILGALNTRLPAATTILGSLNKLIDPNSFPEVFRGLEPNPSNTAKLPSLGNLDPIVAAARPSVVKVAGTGCGGIVEGSGFVIAPGEIVTNAHVVAGVASPKAIDTNGIHNTRVVWFDPNVDLAVLRTSHLAGKPLPIDATERPANTPGVVLGYPGGGDFNAQAAVVIDRFTALGRNIYGRGTTSRDVYSIKAHIIPGNSGGPLIGTDGHVLGIVFATSTTYNNVGYALTGHQVAGELATAERSTTTVKTGACSE